MIARNRDRVEFRHVLRCVFKDIGDNTHREFGGIYIGVTHHELLEDVVLDCSGHLFEFGTLLQTGVDIESQHGKNGTVHGHGHGHLVQGDTVEKHLHILYRADTYTGFTHVAYHTGMVSIVTTVCGKVECHRKSFLTGSKVTAIESVGFCRSGETGILTNCPGADGIHAAVRATEERRQTGHIVQMLHTFQI